MNGSSDRGARAPLPSRARSLVPALVCAAVLAPSACRGTRRASADAQTGDAAPPAAPAASSSAGREALELVSALDRCHVEHRGLLLDFGSDALDDRRGYRLGPFDDVALGTREGASVARMIGQSTSWEIWLDEPLEKPAVWLRVRGGGAKQLHVDVDRRLFGSSRLDHGVLRVLGFGPSDEPLARGHHTLTLRFSGRPRGTIEPHAEIDWARVGTPDDIDATYAAPTRADISQDVALDGVPRRAFALRAPSAVRCALRVPEGAELEVDVGMWGSGRGVAEVRVARDGEEPVTLQQRRVSGGGDSAWTPVRGDLTPYAGQLVELELRSLEATRGGRVLFGDPRVTRPKHESSPRAARTTVLILASGLDRRRVPPWGPIGTQNALGTLVQSGVAFAGYRAPTTVPAAVLASLFTGLEPREHGLVDPSARLAPRVPTLALLAREHGIRSAFFTGTPTSFADFGFDGGWDRFEQISPVADLPVIEPLTRASAWLGKQLAEDEQGRRVVVVQLRGAHPPWDLSRDEVSLLPPQDYSGALDARRGAIVLAHVRHRQNRALRRIDDEDWTRLRALSDAAWQKQELALAQLFATLKKYEAWDDSLIVFAGDVAAGDPPSVPYDPAPPLREDLLAAPLLIKFPRGAAGGSEVRARVTAVDVAATLFEALGIAPAPGVGHSLAGVAQSGGPLDDRPLIATLGVSYATRLGPWLASGELGKVPHLCQIEIDPACTTDLFDRSPIAARATWQWTHAALRGSAALHPAVREPATITPDTAAALVVWGDVEQ